MAAMEVTSDKRIEAVEQEKYAAGRNLPAFDASDRTTITNIIAVGSGAVLSLVCIILSVVNLAKDSARPLTALGQGRVAIGPTSFEAFSLLINLGLTLVTDGLSFIHSASLRWALAEEGRLEFNTNIRLLTSSRLRGPNQWWVNALSLATLMLCYGATSVLFVAPFTAGVEASADIANDYGMCHSYMCANMVSLLALGIGLTTQTVIAAWCLFESRGINTHGQRTIPTWSTNPLNASLTAQHSGLVTHRAGRCMLSVHQQSVSVAGGVSPSARQGDAWSVHRAVRYVVFFLWGLAVVAVAWPSIIALLISSYFSTPDWTWEPWDQSAIILAMSPAENIGQHNRDKAAGAYFSFTSELVLGVLFVTVVQALQTAGLHFTELLVNLSRDEAAWRQATSKKGASYQSEPFYAAATSWENLILFIAKAVLHWVIGQSLFVQAATVVTKSGDDKGALFFIMTWTRLLVFAACAIFMAVFATFLALRKPKGPQPAAWGHLQTLADLVDDWTTNKNGRFWWGDKTGLLAESGDTDVVRHAGTRDEKESLEAISMDCTYAGLDSEIID